MPTADAFKCHGCDELFRDPDGPLWECSRCGGQQTGDDNRCESCHIFMGKLSDTCCPDCQSEEVEEVTAWEGADGELYASQEAEAAWIAEAPARAASIERSRADMADFMAQHRADRLAATERLLPMLVELRPLLGDACPRLVQSIDWTLSELRRDPEMGSVATAFLYFAELGALLAPELSTELAVCTDWRAAVADRQYCEGVVRDAILARMTKAPALTDRMQGSMFSAGSGIGYDMDVAAAGLLAVLRKEETA